MSKPHCCPVCTGNGLVPNGFYNKVGSTWMSSSASPETCKSCNGSGIVWSYEKDESPIVLNLVLESVMTDTKQFATKIGEHLKDIGRKVDAKC